MDEYAHCVYKVTMNFPKNELFGVTSQLRRSALSVILNYIEGYARRKINVRLNFLEISFGSLKESRYILHFSLVERFINNIDIKKLMQSQRRLARCCGEKLII